MAGTPEDTLSPAGKRRLAELRRKFGPEPSPPHGIEVGFVGSPVPRDAVQKMTDANWLSAMREYANTDDRLHDRPVSRSGGARELGGELQEATKNDPDRFARLGASLPDDLAAAYGDSILLGLRAADGAPSDVVFDLVRRLHRIPARPCGRFICDVVARVADAASLPDDIVRLVSWYATEDPDPLPGGATNLRARDDPVRLGLLDVGINCNRGVAAHAIARILGSRPELLDAWRNVIMALVNDESDAVRACVAGVLLPVLALDRDWAVDRVIELVDGRDDVATSVDGEKLIRLAVRTHPEHLLPVIARLVASDDDAVGRVGARLACLASFAIEEARPMAEKAISGGAGARLGAAEVYAANLGVHALRAQCRSALIQLFDDSDPAVRREAGTCFRGLQGTSLAGEEDLFLAFAMSPGLADNPHDILDALVAAPSVPPAATAAICLSVLEAAGSEAGSLASAWSAHMPNVATLAARLCAHADARTSQAGLDLIDALAAQSAYGLDRAVAPFER